MKKQMMCDPPSGWKYGFPKALPEDVKNVTAWLLQNGYPQEEIDKCGNHFYVRYWESESD